MRSAKPISTLAAPFFLSLALALAQVCTLGCEFLGCASAAEATGRAEHSAAHCRQPEPEPREGERQPDCGKHDFAAAFEPPAYSSTPATPPPPATHTAEPASPFAFDFRRQAALVGRGAPLRSPPRRETRTILRI
jgi:hypothetical protein